MASNMFIKMGDIEGEAPPDGNHGKEIELVKWEWGITQKGKAKFGAGLTVGNAHYESLIFTHFIDKSTPNLWKNCVLGTSVGEAILSVCKASGGSEDYLTIKLKDTMITRVHPHGNMGELGLEDVELQFDAVTIEYKPQKDDHNMDAAVSFTYDIKNEKE